MASHRKPPQRALIAPTSHAAATLAMAGAFTTALTGNGQAAPPPDSQQVPAQVAELYRQAEQATEKYNGAKEQADAARHRLDELQDQLARRAEQINQARGRLGTLAATRYRSGGIDPAIQLILTDDPQQYLENVSLLDRMASEQAATLRGLAVQQRQAQQLRDQAAAQLSTLAGDQRELAAAKQAMDAKLEQARHLLERLAPAHQPQTAPADSPAPAVPATDLRATQAVAFALAQLGKPYAWGATGPDSYDCSGLVQAAWHAAGIALPRTTYSQINAGRRISRSALQPGDLVFFYSGVSHVGIYIGNGRMIHAPHPGAPVRIAPVSEMPFAGATRPA